uniref:Uncharacterized protein n=1 Tax=Nelumbo nucifera TaxID=4432 RepID=A0A822ZGW2_NELNU|nr:TPA_asm: hypothetical protein HUJ06_002083 [Nelumbo nucifera]
MLCPPIESLTASGSLPSIFALNDGFAHSSDPLTGQETSTTTPSTEAPPPSPSPLSKMMETSQKMASSSITTAYWLVLVLRPMKRLLFRPGGFCSLIKLISKGTPNRNPR